MAVRESQAQWEQQAVHVANAPVLYPQGSACGRYGVALANMYPEARSVGLWLRHGWYIAIAYVIGFFAMLVLLGWHLTRTTGNALRIRTGPASLSGKNH
jgi:hypothetical protein